MAQPMLTHKIFRHLWFRVGLGVLLSSLIGFALVQTFAPLPTALAAGITVNTTVDEDADNADCSLREAIKAANNNAAYRGCAAGSGADVITLPAGTYTLNDQLPDVSSEITIDGDNASPTIVQANASPNVATYRIFEVLGSGNLTLNFLTLQNGNCPNALSCTGPDQDSDKGKGGAILTSGTLTVNDSTIKNNKSSGTGGGIYLRQGTLTLLRTTVQDNSTSGGSGGGIGGGSGNISVTDSTFSDNAASGGGGMSTGSSNSLVAVTGSTFSGNSAGSGSGGGIGASGNLSVTLSIFQNNTAGRGAGLSNSYGGNTASVVGNSTFYSNTATSKGGGIYNDGDLTVVNSTLSENSAPDGGGFYNDPLKRDQDNIYPVVNLKNTIFANSTSGNDCYNYANGLPLRPPMGNNNLIETDSAGNNACGTTAPINGSDPLLGTLTGSPAYLPLLSGSPAIDGGNNADCAGSGVGNDSQNGVTRPVGANCDIGSFEVGVPATPKTFVVNTNADTDDGSCDALGTGTGNMDCTLREAINAANANGAADTINFVPTITSGIMWLSASLPDISDDVTIDGVGTDPQGIININANKLHQILTIRSGKTLNLQNNIGIANGLGATCGAQSNAGGGICNDGGTLNANNIAFYTSTAAGNGDYTSTAAGNGAALYNNGGTVNGTAVGFYDNSATGDGGGLYNNGGTVTLDNSEFRGNSAGENIFSGGGIYNDGTLTVINSTFISNTSALSGGGIATTNSVMQVTGSTFTGNSVPGGGLGGGIGGWNNAVMTVTNSTISGNFSGALGGGIYNDGSNLTVINSTISGNSIEGDFPDGGGGIYNYGTLTLINSIIANNVGSDCTGSSTGNNNLIEDAAGACGFTNGVNGNIVGSDPNLGSLAYNGGSTETMELLTGSPAIDAGDDATCAAAPVNGVDQRGVTRPQGPECDIGAYEADATAPTATPTPTVTSTPTATATGTNTPTPTNTATTVPGSTATSTPTASATATNTPTPTASATATVTPTPTATATTVPGSTATPTATATATASASPTATATATSTTMATATATATSTSTPNTAVFQVLSVSPNEGFNNQPVNIVITGAAFSGTPQVFLGSNSLSNVVLDSSTQLRATVPAGLAPDTYDLIVINGNNTTALLAQSYTVRTTVPTITLVQPSTGISDFPNVIGIYGFNFANGVEVKLGDTVLDAVLIGDKGSFIQATIPADLPAGTYNIVVRNPDNTTVTKTDAYEVYSTLNNDDFYANGYEIWTDPVAPRATGATKIGVIIHRQGGKTTLANVTARFYLGEPNNGGTVLGDGIIDFLSIRSSATTSAVNWTPPAPGSYTLWAVIDPDGFVNESIETNNVVSRTLTVLPPAPDGVPPRVDSFSINSGAANTTQQTVSLDASATDVSPSSGLRSILYKEFEYNQNTAQWLPINNSGWLDYEANRTSKSWQLAPAAGLKYMQAWAADNAGNIALFPFNGYINYLPPTDRVGTNQTRSYFFTLAVGQRLTAQVIPSTGDPDLFVWSPDQNAPPYVSNLSGGNEEVSFVATVAGVYQVEVYGFAKSDYQLSVNITNSAAGRSASQVGGVDPNKPQPSSPVIPRNDQGPGNQQSVPTAPTAPPADTSLKLYLPSVVR